MSCLKCINLAAPAQQLIAMRIDPSDPEAGVRICKRRWGPFIPREASVDSTQKTRAFGIDSAKRNQLVVDDPPRDTEKSLNAKTEAFALLESTGEGVYEARLYRLKGELLLNHYREQRLRASIQQQAEKMLSKIA